MCGRGLVRHPAQHGLNVATRLCEASDRAIRQSSSPIARLRQSADVTGMCWVARLSLAARLVSKEAPHVLCQNPADFMKPVIIEHEVSLVPSDAAVQRMCAHCRFVNKKDNLSSFACPKTQLRFYVCNKSCQTAFYKEHKKRLGDGRWQGGNCTYA